MCPPTRIVIVSMDTRGGVQPYLALAVALRDAGHDVRLAAPADFRDRVEARGVRAAPLSGSVEEALRGVAGAPEQGLLATVRTSRREAAGRIATWTDELLAASEGAQLLVGGVGGRVLGEAVAEKLGVPFLDAHLQPLGLRGLPPVLLPNLPRWLHGLGHAASDFALWAPFGSLMRAGRARLGLPARRTTAPSRPTLYALSRHVIPEEALAETPHHVTGYWTRPEPAWTPPPALVAFVAAGPAVCVGFGSMASRDPAALSKLVVAAARQARVRLILLTGWGGLGEVAGDDVFALPEAPHDWLLPRVAGVVHHGGAGTTGAGLLAGVPALVVPFSVDQPFWGSRVHALGVGPRPIPRRQLTVARLGEGLRALVEDDAMRRRAEALGALVRAEEGVRAAVRVIEGALR